MKSLSFLMVIITMTTAISTSDRNQWAEFKSSHSKTYKSSVEEAYRYAVFKSNVRKIRDHNDKYNRGQSSYTLDINVFADLTEEEFMSRMMQSKRSKPSLSTKLQQIEFDGDLPARVNWTEEGAVTPVKDQGDCGSCWSFSTTGCLESQYFLKTQKLISLSEQQLVDCASTCFGCDGGYLDKALEYVEANGLISEDSYSYEGIDNECRYNGSEVAVRIKSFVALPSGNETALQIALVKYGPISIAIDATIELQFYSSGVLDDDSCGNSVPELNHAVLATGYGVLEGKEYWIVKNSWGKSWGQNGYLLMSRNANNQCGIATEPVYPTF